MVRCCQGVTAVVVFTLGCLSAESQVLRIDEWRPEVLVSAGPAALMEGDSAAGDWTSIGAGVTLPVFGRLSTQFEVSRMLGTAVKEVDSVLVRCRGDVCGAPEPFKFRTLPRKSGFTARNITV